MKEVVFVIVWMWVFDVDVMDFCSYYDGFGQDIYEKQFCGGFEIIYEDYEFGFDKFEGVVCMSELFLWLFLVILICECFVEFVEVVCMLLQFIVCLEYFYVCGVFGGLWMFVDLFMLVKVEVEK